MRKNLIFGIVFFIAGLLIAVGPKTIFSVCPSDGEMIMKCFYVAQTEFALGIETAALGVLLALQKSRAAHRATSIALALNGIVVFLVPNVLIGVCGNEHMQCNSLTKPALSIISIVVVVLAVLSTVLLSFKDSKNNE